MNTKVYRACAVPQCDNKSSKTPNKLFVFVPLNKTIRDEWLKLAWRDSTTILPNTHLYFCEDHFDLPNDMENFMQYHLMGSVSQIRMKRGCVPSRFECQTDFRKRLLGSTEQQYIYKKQRKMCGTGREEGKSSSDESTSPPICNEWLPRPDVCRCCLARAGSQDLMATCSDEHGSQVLLDMLKDCLGISLSNISECGPSRLVCDKCADNLHTVHLFKQQVIAAEKAFVEYYGDGTGNNVDLSIVKIEQDLDLEEHNPGYHGMAIKVDYDECNQESDALMSNVNRQEIQPDVVKVKKTISISKFKDKTEKNLAKNSKAHSQIRIQIGKLWELARNKPQKTAVILTKIYQYLVPVTSLRQSLILVTI